MKSILRLLFAFALAVPALAQEPDTKARLIEEVLQHLDLKALTATAYDIVMNDPMAQSDGVDITLTDEERVAAEQAQTQNRADRRAFRTMVLDRLDYPRYAREIYAPLLARAFSVEELQQLLAFLKTPAGAKVARIIPEVSTATAAKAAPMLQGDIRRITAEMAREDRKKNPWKATLDDMRAIASALDNYAIDNSAYPTGDFAAVKAALVPNYIAALPEKDVWGQAFLYVSDGPSYRLVSAGADRQLDGTSRNIDTTATPRHSDTPEADIIFQNGVLLQSPR